MVSSENTHVSNIIQTVQAVLIIRNIHRYRYTYIYIRLHVTTINEKEAMNLKESREAWRRVYEGILRGEGEGEMM